MRDFSAQTGNAPGQIRGDRAVIESGFPPLFIEVMTFISMTMGINVALRVGNPPRIGFGDDSKPMGVKQNTGAAFLYKGLIPLKKEYLKKKSAEVDIPIKGSDPPMTYPEYYGSSQLRVSLNDVLSDEKSYDRIEEKDGKLYLYPKASLIDSNPENFKDSDVVKNTVFVIDLRDQQNPVIDQEKLLSQLPKFKDQYAKVVEPKWWKPEFGDFAQVKFRSMPVSSYTQPAAAQAQTPTPEPFMVLGGANAKGAKLENQRAITGDVDLFLIVSQIQSLTRSVENSDKPFNLSVLKERLEFAKVFTEIVALMEEHVSGIQGGGVSLDDLKIEGFTNPTEAAMIYMVNKLFGAEGVKTAQLILHGSEVYNPGTPSEIGPLLHVLPTGERILTRNEDQLISLVQSGDYLATYPIGVHPKWNMEKWGDVVKNKIELGQPLNAQTLEAYDSQKATGVAAVGQAIKGALGGLVNRVRSSSFSEQVSAPTSGPGTPELLRKRSSTLSKNNAERAASRESSPLVSRKTSPTQNSTPVSSPQVIGTLSPTENSTPLSSPDVTRNSSVPQDSSPPAVSLEGRGKVARPAWAVSRVSAQPSQALSAKPSHDAHADSSSSRSASPEKKEEPGRAAWTKSQSIGKAAQSAQDTSHQEDQAKTSTVPSYSSKG